MFDYLDVVQNLLDGTPSDDEEVAVVQNTGIPSGDEEVAQLVTPSSKPPTFPPEQRSARPLNGIIKPGPNDVLFGRGAGTNQNPGNKTYRDFVRSHMYFYFMAKKSHKTLMAKGVVDELRGSSPPVRFLKQDAKTKLWVDVGDTLGRQKTSQAFRDCLEKEKRLPKEERWSLFDYSPTDDEEGNADDETKLFTPEQRSGLIFTLFLDGIIQPGPNDVLFGDDGCQYSHFGNYGTNSYFDLVKSHMDLYSRTRDRDKSLVAKGIVEKVRALSPLGRFLKRDAETNCWVILGDEEAVAETSQTLRKNQLHYSFTRPPPTCDGSIPQGPLFEIYKTLMATEFISDWRALSPPPGRFLRQDTEAEIKFCEDVGDLFAPEKTSQTLRDCKRENGSHDLDAGTEGMNGTTCEPPYQHVEPVLLPFQAHPQPEPKIDPTEFGLQAGATIPQVYNEIDSAGFSRLPEAMFKNNLRL